MKEIKIDIKDFISKFDKSYLEFYTKERTFNVLYGGAGAGKSFFMSHLLILICILSKVPINILVLREIASTLQDSIFREVLNALDNFENLNQFYKVNKSTKTIYFKNGSTILFRGASDVNKLKGVDISYVFLEEADQISKDNYDILKTRIRSNASKIRYYIAFNPTSTESWIYEHFFDSSSKYFEGHNNINIQKVTFLNNLKNLPIEYIKNLMSFKKSNLYMYSVYVLGNFGQLGKKVFTNYKKGTLEPNELIRSGYKRQTGMDLGFTNDETAIIEAFVNTNEKKLYVHSEFYKVKATEENIKDYIKANRLDTHKIVSDNNEPRLLDNLRANGVRNLYKANKGKNSVDFMFYSLEQYEIIINPVCINTFAEFDNLVYKKNKNGKYTNERISTLSKSDGDHSISAIRYLMEDFTKNNRQTLNLSNPLKSAYGI